MKKLLFFIPFLFPILNFAQCEVKGKIKIVSFGEDYKVRKVGLGDAYVNLKAKLVEFGTFCAFISLICSGYALLLSNL